MNSVLVHRFMDAPILGLSRAWPVNVLSIEKQAQVIATLSEGCSIRATGRLCGVHRDTVMRLAVNLGERCRELHNRLFCNLQVASIQIDELWSYVRKKQKQVTLEDGADTGDQYIFLAIDALSRAWLSMHVGKRDMGNTLLFLGDLRQRVVNRPQISSDAFSPYAEAIACTFGTAVHYAQIIKPSKEGFVFVPRWQGQPQPQQVKKHVLWGEPDPTKISTSLIERSNLTARQHSRRLTRMTTGFSKKLRQHRASLDLQLAYYNLCRVHSTIRTTPAVALGVTDHPWSVEELILATQDLSDLPLRPKPFIRKSTPRRGLVIRNRLLYSSEKISACQGTISTRLGVRSAIRWISSAALKEPLKNSRHSRIFNATS